MKVSNKIKQFIVLVLISSSLGINAQDFTAITNSLKIGDVKSFSQNFDSNLELTILDNEAIYSKTQIETILKDFLSKNKPTDYKTVHKGNSGNGAFFQIGELSTTNNIYRTYIYAKNINGNF